MADNIELNTSSDDEIVAEDVFYDDGGVGDYTNTQEAIDGIANNLQMALGLLEYINDSLSEI